MRKIILILALLLGSMGVSHAAMILGDFPSYLGTCCGSVAPANWTRLQNALGTGLPLTAPMIYMDGTHAHTDWPGDLGDYMNGLAAFAPWNPPAVPYMSLPMQDSLASGDTAFQQIIGGQWDSVITSLITTIKNAGYTKMILRPGWEMNLGLVTSSNASDYAAAFDHIAALAHSQTGITVLVFFCPNDGNPVPNTPLANYTPHTSSMDLIGEDIYGEPFQVDTAPLRVATGNDITVGSMIALSKSLGVPFAIGETGGAATNTAFAPNLAQAIVNNQNGLTIGLIGLYVDNSAGAGDWSTDPAAVNAWRSALTTILATQSSAFAINNISTVQANTSFAESGTISGYSMAPTMQYSDDGVTWLSLPGGATVTSTTFTFTHPGLAATGAQTTYVRDANNTSASVVSNGFIVQGPASISDTVITTVGPVITDSLGETFGLTSGAQINVCAGTCAVDPVTSNVVELAYVNGLVWQLNTSGNWYSKPNAAAAWTGPTTQSPLPSVGVWQQAQLTLSYMPHGYMNYQYILLNYNAANKAVLMVYEHENDEGNPCYNGSNNCTYLSQPLPNGAGPETWYDNAGFQSAYCANGCIILMPYADQVADPSGQTQNFGGYNDTPDSQPNEQGVMALIAQFKSQFNVGPVYVTGDSLGGIGAWAACMDHGINTGTINHIVTACMPFSGNIYRNGINGSVTNAQASQVAAGPVIFAVNGSGDTNSSNPVNWTNPMWTAITGNTNYPGPPAGGRAGTSSYYYLLDTTLGHDVWDTYRPLPTGKPMLDILFAQTGTGGGGGGTPMSPLPAGYLNSAGNQVTDGSGNDVRMSCSGYNEPTGNYSSDMNIMRNQGFNCVRAPWYDATTCPGGVCSFTTMDAIVSAATANNMKVIFDHHGNEGVNGNNGCLSQQANGLWYDVNQAAPWNAIGNGTDGCGTTGTVNYSRFKSDWIAIATHYAGNSTVIGFDLHNEPTTYGNTCCGSTGTYGANWGSGNGGDMRAMANDVGAAILAADPGALIIIEGIINNGTLFNGVTRGSASYPIVTGPYMDLTTFSSNPTTCCSGKLVASIHEYPTSISGNNPDSGPNMQTIRTTTWGFLETNNAFPVWIGEFGASLDNSNGNLSDEQAWASGVISYMNGTSGTAGAPTFTGCQQPMGGDWWTFGNLAGQVPDGTLNPDGTSKAGQQTYWSQMLYTTCASSGGGGPGATTTTAQRSADFLNALSVQGCLTEGGTADCNAGTQFLADLNYIGTTHVRSGLDVSTSGPSFTALTTLLNGGISMVSQVPYGTIAPATQIAQQHAWQAINPNAVYAIDGINEPELATITYNGTTGGGPSLPWTIVSQYMADYITALLADAPLKNLPIYGVSRAGAETNDAGLQFLTVQGGHSSVANGTVLGKTFSQHIYTMDQNTFHSPGPTAACQMDDPAAGDATTVENQWNNITTFAGNFSGYANQAAVLAAGPRVITEYGYQTNNVRAGGDNVNADKAGRCMLNGLLYAWSAGEGLINIYSMYDGGSGFGIFASSGVPNTQAKYLHNMITPMLDAGSTARTFTPNSLNYTLSNMPTYGQSLLFQKTNGHFEFVFWRNDTNWNVAAGTPITIAPVNVTLTIGNGLVQPMAEYDAVTGTTPVQSVNANAITFPLADAPVIIDITAAPPTQPGNMRWNPLDQSANIVLSNGNLTATVSQATKSSQSVRATIAISGKVCFEGTASVITPNWDFGVANSSYSLTLPAGLGGDSNGIGFDPNSAAAPQAIIYNNTILASLTAVDPFSADFSSAFGGAAVPVSPNGEAETICVDTVAKSFWATNATMRAIGYPWNDSTTANPATATGGLPFSGLSGPYFITFNSLDTTGTNVLNATGPFTVALPTGFTPAQAATANNGHPFILIFGENERHANDNWMMPFATPVSLTR